MAFHRIKYHLQPLRLVSLMRKYSYLVCQVKFVFETSHWKPQGTIFVLILFTITNNDLIEIMNTDDVT